MYKLIRYRWRQTVSHTRGKCVTDVEVRTSPVDARIGNGDRRVQVIESCVAWEKAHRCGEARVCRSAGSNAKTGNMPTDSSTAPPKLGARHGALIRITEGIRENRDPCQLFRLLLAQLRAIVPFDGIAQYDESEKSCTGIHATMACSRR